MADLCRGFWKRETGTGQQMAQLHDRYDDDDDDDDDDDILKGDFKEIDREKCLTSEMLRLVDASNISL